MLKIMLNDLLDSLPIRLRDWQLIGAIVLIFALVFLPFAAAAALTVWLLDLPWPQWGDIMALLMAVTFIGWGLFSWFKSAIDRARAK